MDVYLVPIGPERHELYCEVPDEPDGPVDGRGDGSGGPGSESPKGFFKRLKERFRAMLAEAERERREGRSESADPAGQESFLTRMKARTMRWVAESIAEQRLLWHLRSQTSACLYYPDDLDAARAEALLRAQLRKDFEKHRFWLIIDSLLFIGSGLLFFVPGPNIVAYYFAFRLVGHYLSMQGAKNGLSGVEWRMEGSPVLVELRRAMTLEPGARNERVQDVAVRLRLEHLASFFERTATLQSQPS